MRAFALVTAAALVAQLTIGETLAAGPEPYNLSGSVVYQHCKSNDVYCADFMVTMDSALATLIKLGFLKQLTCAPSGATLLQDRLIFLRFAEQHPENLQRNAAEIYLAAEMQAYPCRGSGG